MSKNQFVDLKKIDDSELIYILSVLLKVPESRVFDFIKKFDSNSILYKKIGEFIKFIGDKKIKELHEIGREAVIEEEKSEFDRKITRMTGSFLTEIETYLKQENLTLPPPTIRNIDAFLYLINANYYEEIKEQNKNIRREFLIEQLLFLISYHLKENNISKFNENHVKEILDLCIFIPENIKRKILVEFTNAKTKKGKDVSYKIIHKDIKGGKDNYLEARARANNNRIPEWNFNNEFNYITLIEALEVCEDFQELGIGSAEDLCWDIDFIKNMISMIHTNYKDELLRLNEEYSCFMLTGKFIFYTMAYAVEEEIPKVTSDVVLASFAEWDGLPFDLKLRILDDLFEQEKLDYSSHPYRDKKPEKKTYQKKIILFKVKDSKQEDK